MIELQCEGFLNTPALWTGQSFGVQQFPFPRINLQEVTIQPMPSKRRLGHQIEHIFHQLLPYANQYAVVLNNLPIRENGITLGEIDFILKDISTNKLIHVELTYKFYLIDPNIPDPIKQLVGPNRKDRFFDKIQKITTKQFPLLQTAQGKKALETLDLDTKNIEHQCCFKGQLYRPYGQSYPIASNINKDCIKGYWLSRQVFDSSPYKDYEYYVPSKSEWVIEAHPNVSWLNHRDTLAVIQSLLTAERSPMVWIKKENGMLEKFFVVWW